MADITFKETSDIIFVTSYDEGTDEVAEETEHFEAGETLPDVDILNEWDNTIDIQCGDGSCAYHIPRAIIEIS